MFFLSLRLLFHLLKGETAAETTIERKNFLRKLASSQKQLTKSREGL